MTTHECRDVRAGSVRAPAEGRTFEAEVMHYGIVDDYDTVFDPGVFSRSLESRMPRLTWGHDWTDLIGRVVDFKDTNDSLTIVGELDPFDAVPRAFQAYTQLQTGTLDNFSVGFRRSETRDVEGRTHFVTATLDEVALVLSGAVPGTNTKDVRDAQGQPVKPPKMVQVRSGLAVPLDTLIEIARQKAAGLLTDEEAGIALDLAAGGAGTPTGESGSAEAGAPSAGDVPASELDLDALAALDSLGFASDL